MHRRNILWGALSAFGAGFATSRAGAAAETSPAAKLKVVYHLNDLDKVSFVAGNIQNHLDGVGDRAGGSRPGTARAELQSQGYLYLRP